MATSQYKAFATGVGANTLPYSAYAALTTLIGQGFAAGTAQSNQFNTLMRQCSVPAATLAKFAADYSGLDVNDDGNLFVVALTAAVQAAAAATNAVPAGAVAGFLRTSAPSGWLALQGQIVNIADYPNLFALWGVTFGGNGTTTFGVPDGRAEFLRGVDGGRNVDPGRTYGSAQTQQLARHKHMTSTGEFGYGSGAFGTTDTGGRKGTDGSDFDNYWYMTNDGSDYDAVVNPAGVVGDETRPRNIAVLWCVKT